MKNKIISAILEIKKAGARKIPLGSAEYYAPFEKCFDLMRSGDITERRNGLFLSLGADELLKSFACGTERSSFENFIFLAEVTDISRRYRRCFAIFLRR